MKEVERRREVGPYFCNSTLSLSEEVRISRLSRGHHARQPVEQNRKGGAMDRTPAVACE